MVIAVGLSTVLAIAMSANAAGITLTNGGFGQRSGDVGSFGFAVCDSGSVLFSGGVPISVTANGVPDVVSFTSPLAASSCGYTYLPYASFNMVPGNTYSISVTIDPQHSLITNINNQATYASVMVPSASRGQVLGARTMSDAEHQFLLGELAQAATTLEGLLFKIGRL